MDQRDINENTKESSYSQTKCISFELEEGVVLGLQKLRRTLGFPIESMISQSLRELINAFLPLADLHEQGKLDANCLTEVQKAIELLIIKTDVAKARIDKDIKKITKQKKTELQDSK